MTVVLAQWARDLLKRCMPNTTPLSGAISSLLFEILLAIVSVSE